MAYKRFILLLILWFFVSVGNSFAGGWPQSAPVNPQSLFSNYREYLSLSPEIAYHIDQAWGITIRAGTAFLGKNIFASPSFTFGIFNKNLNLKTN